MTVDVASRKLPGYRFYRDVLGSPKYIVAPMVDQSELAWRILSRKYGAEVVYTPMINAKLFAGNNKKYQIDNFNMLFGEEGGPSDRPLIVQFCGNDPEALLAAAKMVEPHCDAVDINFGCPQDIARRGKYGAFLQDDWDLVYRLINVLHKNLSIPVTAKFRVFPTVEKTVAYAKMMESAGAQILSCHGRLREQRGHNSGLADWAKIRAVKEAVSVPVFANGNILYHSDIAKCLEATGADGIMSAEGNLYNPALFDSRPATYRHADLAIEYLEIAKSLRTVTSPGAIKAHLFKLYRPALDRNHDLRERLAKAHGKPDSIIGEYLDIAQEMKRRMDRDAEEANDVSTAPASVLTNGLQDIPHWRAQPYIRPPPPQPSAKKAVVLATTPSLALAPSNTNGTLAGDVGNIPLAIGVNGKRNQVEVISDNDEDVKRAKPNSERSAVSV